MAKKSTAVSVPVSTDRRVSVNATSTSTSTVTVNSFPVAYGQNPTPAKGVEDAVYGYIQAVRALGRTHISTLEIASALNLPVSSVQQASAALISKGVKLHG